MEIKINKKYLVLPVSKFVGKRTLTFKHNGTVVDSITVRLDFENPMHYFFYNVEKYICDSLDVCSSPDIALERLEETQSSCEREVSAPFAPFLHFAPKTGWLNDPNGLFVYTSPITGKRTYHMFYQHNPYDYVWGNMHWGHAVSEDLFNWQHFGDALYPDCMGTMFSGSAVVDDGNKSGLKLGEEDVILLFYTAAGNTSVLSEGKQFTQCMAYSTDGGKTFTKYRSNPVVENIEFGNRDPKVVWCEELNSFVMALYLKDNDFCLLTSENLINWSEIQRFTIENDAECPDIFAIYTKEGQKKWVISAASGYYLVGDFKNGRFVATQNVKRFGCGGYNYAAQSFFGETTDGALRLDWQRDTYFGNMPICGQMSIPYKLGLKEEDGGYVLFASLDAGIEKHLSECASFENLALSNAESLRIKADKAAYIIEAKLNFLQNGCAKIELFGATITIENGQNGIYVCGNCACAQCSLDLQIVADTASIEIFANGGTFMHAFAHLADFNLKNIVVTADVPLVFSSFSVKKTKV